MAESENQNKNSEDLLTILHLLVPVPLSPICVAVQRQGFKLPLSLSFTPFSPLPPSLFVSLLLTPSPSPSPSLSFSPSLCI